MNTNYKMPTSVKKNILSKLLPVRYLKYMLVSLFLLTFSPMLMFYFEPALLNVKIIHYIIATISISLILESIVFGIIVFQTKNPYMKELKELFGYTES